MNRLCHQCQRGDVAIIPQAPFEIRGKITRVMDFHFFRADHSPAALRFDSAHRCQSLWHAVAKAIAVRYLIKTVRSDHRTDPNRFEQYVVWVVHKTFLALNGGQWLSA